MILKNIVLENFRCFPSYKTELDQRFNYILGENGTGKTAFLEALSVLCTGHSFRVREIAPLILHTQPHLTVSATLSEGEQILVKKSTKSQTAIKINDQPCLRTSELVTLLPSQVIYQDIFQIIDAGPVYRRQLLDWGVFHVKPFYHQTFHQYKQALKQRNALLKKKSSLSTLSYWDKTLNELAQKIDDMRKEYISLLNPVFKKNIASMTKTDCQINYYNGWSKSDHSLIEVLEKNYETDKAREYTQYGPHHADLEIISSNGTVKRFLSRGQQKIMLISLRISQALLLNKPCLYIWDDICAELDEYHLTQLAYLIREIPGQFFISGIYINQSPLVRINPGTILIMK